MKMTTSRRGFRHRLTVLAVMMPMMVTSFVAASAAQTLTGRWWIVLGASPAPGYTGQDFTAARQAGKAAKRCGIDTMGDFSAKFENFAPDLYVTVAGGYRTREEAAAALEKVRPCVPGAYQKRGAYSGE